MANDKTDESPEVVLGMAALANLLDAGGHGAMSLVHGSDRAGVVALSRIADRLTSDAEVRDAARVVVRLWREGPLYSSPQFASAMARLARAAGP